MHQELAQVCPILLQISVRFWTKWEENCVKLLKSNTWELTAYPLKHSYKTFVKKSLLKVSSRVELFLVLCLPSRRLEHLLGFCLSGARIQMYARAILGKNIIINFLSILGNLKNMKEIRDISEEACGFNWSFEVQSTLNPWSWECLAKKQT